MTTPLIPSDQLVNMWSDWNPQPDSSMARLLDAAKHALKLDAMLREVEWVMTGNDLEIWSCPICEMYRESGHTPDCRLAALIPPPTGPEHEEAPTEEIMALMQCSICGGPEPDTFRNFQQGWVHARCDGQQSEQDEN